MINAVGTSEGFCAQSAAIFQLVGKFLLVFKILIPVLLIVFGVIDLGRAVVATDDKKVKESVGRLIRRIIVGIIIFFIPTIITIAFNLVEEFKNYEEEYTICKRCILDPGSTNDEKTGCEDYVRKYENYKDDDTIDTNSKTNTNDNELDVVLEPESDEEYKK